MVYPLFPKVSVSLSSSASEGAMRHDLNAQTLPHQGRSWPLTIGWGCGCGSCLTATVLCTRRLERSFSPPLGFKATTAVLWRHGFQGARFAVNHGIFSASHDSSQYRAGHILTESDYAFPPDKVTFILSPFWLLVWSRISNFRLSVSGEQLLFAWSQPIRVFQRKYRAACCLCWYRFRSRAIRSQSCGLCLYHFSHTTSEIMGDKWWHKCWGTTASGIPPRYFARNTSGTTQPGIPPSVPCGMTVGATPSWCSSRRLCQQRLRSCTGWCSTQCPWWHDCWSYTFWCSSRRLCQ
jgi:hypothetical protein